MPVTICCNCEREKMKTIHTPDGFCIKNNMLIFSGLIISLFFPIRSPNAQVFKDDFKGIERVMPGGEKKLYPDHKKWAFTFWPGTKWPDSYGDGTNWLEGNGESQTYLSPFTEKIKGKPVPVNLRYDPFEITEQGLHIKADVLTPEQQKAYHVGGHRKFGSGILLSRQSFQYGKFTIVAKLPSARGSWSAFWLLPEKRMWPPEIDVFEGMAWGPHKKKIHSGFLVPKDEKGTYSDWFDLPFNPSEDFHAYTLDWTEEKMSVSVDGETLWEKPTPPSMKQPMYMLVNLAVGGRWPYNELDIKPIDGMGQERLLKGSSTIIQDYPAEFIIKSVTVEGL
jgi:hypothetical protein